MIDGSIFNTVDALGVNKTCILQRVDTYDVDMKSTETTADDVLRDQPCLTLSQGYWHFKWCHRQSVVQVMAPSSVGGARTYVLLSGYACPGHVMCSTLPVHTMPVHTMMKTMQYHPNQFGQIKTSIDLCAFSKTTGLLAWIK